MNPLKIIGRKFDARSAHPREFVRRRIADSADNLNRAGRDAARVEVVNEAMARLTELCYAIDAGRLCNVDSATGRLLIPAPFGDHGWKFYGLRYREGRTLRTILWDRQDTFKPGRVRPPLYSYDADTRAWYLNIGDYATLDAAGWYLSRAEITIAEWRGAIGSAAKSAAKGAAQRASTGAARSTA